MPRSPGGAGDRSPRSPMAQNVPTLSMFGGGGFDKSMHSDSSASSSSAKMRFNKVLAVVKLGGSLAGNRRQRQAKAKITEESVDGADGRPKSPRQRKRRTLGGDITTPRSPSTHCQDCPWLFKEVETSPDQLLAAVRLGRSAVVPEAGRRRLSALGERSARRRSNQSGDGGVTVQQPSPRAGTAGEGGRRRGTSAHRRRDELEGSALHEPGRLMPGAELCPRPSDASLGSGCGGSRAGSLIPADREHSGVSPRRNSMSPPGTPRERKRRSDWSGGHGSPAGGTISPRGHEGIQTEELAEHQKYWKDITRSLTDILGPIQMSQFWGIAKIRRNWLLTRTYGGFIMFRVRRSAARAVIGVILACCITYGIRRDKLEVWKEWYKVRRENKRRRRRRQQIACDTMMAQVTSTHRCSKFGAWREWARKRATKRNFKLLCETGSNSQRRYFYAKWKKFNTESRRAKEDVMKCIDFATEAFNYNLERVYSLEDGIGEMRDMLDNVEQGLDDEAEWRMEDDMEQHRQARAGGLDDMAYSLVAMDKRQRRMY